MHLRHSHSNNNSHRCSSSRCKVMWLHIIRDMAHHKVNIEEVVVVDEDVEAEAVNISKVKIMIITIMGIMHNSNNIISIINIIKTEIIINNNSNMHSRIISMCRNNKVRVKLRVRMKDKVQMMVQSER